jgi:predicted nucleic acid-binding protein
MAAHEAIIDTNVVYAGLYSAAGASHQVLRSIERGDLQPVLSTTLLFEYEEVLRRDQEFLRLSDEAVKDVLDGLCFHAKHCRIHFLWRPVLTDPKDDHVLELAVAAGSVDIVTHNVADFEMAVRFGIRILTPGQLLGELK